MVEKKGSSIMNTFVQKMSDDQLEQQMLRAECDLSFYRRRHALVMKEVNRRRLQNATPDENAEEKVT